MNLYPVLVLIVTLCGRCRHLICRGDGGGTAISLCHLVSDRPVFGRRDLMDPGALPGDRERLRDRARTRPGCSCRNVGQARSRATKKWGSLASMRPRVRARGHLCTRYIINFSHGNTTRVSYEILNVQITYRGEFSHPHSLATCFPSPEMLSETCFLCIFPGCTVWMVGPGPQHQSTVSQPRGPPGTTDRSPPVWTQGPLAAWRR